MFGLAIGTLRERWPALLGTFAAVALGAALIISAVEVATEFGHAVPKGPQRYRAAPTVLAAATAPDGRISSDPLAQRRALDPGLVAATAAEPGVRRTVVDRTIAVRLPKLGAELVGRPWSARLMAPYRLVAGRAPAAPGELAATVGGPADRVGDRPTIVTTAGVTRMRVVGVVKPGHGVESSIERPLFFSDGEAARLAPAVDAVAVWPAGVRPAVRALAAEVPGTVALTGNRRASLEPDIGGLVAVGAALLLSLMVMTVCCVAVFVIGSTSSLAVALRRRELGLLRALGATPRQARRLVFAESTLLGLAGGAAGAVLSVAVAPALAAWLDGHGLAPAGAHVGPQADVMLLGALSVVPVAVLGAWSTARRAARVRPAEALRDAAVDRGVMTLGRWTIGLLSLAGAVAIAVSTGVQGRLDAQLPLTFAEAMLLVTALTLLAPLFTPRLVALLLLPAARARGALGMLVRADARAAVRRTGSLAAPVILSVGLVAALASVLDSLEASDRTSAQTRVAPGLTAVAAPGSLGLTDGDLVALRATSGVAVAATLDTDLRIGSGESDPQATSGVDPDGIDLVLRSRVVEGSLTGFGGNEVAVGKAAASRLGARIGGSLTARLADGTTQSLAVVAILASGLDPTSLWVPRAVLVGHAGPTAATTAYLAPGAGLDGERGLIAARRVAATRALVVTGGAGRRVSDPTDSSNMNRLALEVILGAALLYVLIALISTAAVSTAARRGQLAALRLAGATPRQVVGLVVAEAVTVTGVGALLGLVVALVVVTGLRSGIDPAAGPAKVVMPWALLVAIWGTCAVCTAAASGLAAHRTQRPAAHLLLTGRAT